MAYNFKLDVGRGSWRIYMEKTTPGTGAWASNYQYTVTINGVQVGNGRASYDFRTWGYSDLGEITLASGSYSLQTGNNSGSAYYAGGYSNTSDSDSYYYSPPSYSHSITFNDNGGSGGPGTQSCGSSGTQNSFTATLSSTRPTKSGYTFLGWSTSNTATTASYQPSGTYTFNSQNVTLYAVWSQITYTHSITFNDNGGSGGPGTKSYGSTTTQNQFSGKIPDTVPVRSGYTFLGWSDSATGSPQYQPGTTYTFSTQNPILYAIWRINCYIKVNGSWKVGECYRKTNGTWVQGVPKVKIDGAWTE